MDFDFFAEEFACDARDRSAVGHDDDWVVVHRLGSQEHVHDSFLERVVAFALGQFAGVIHHKFDQLGMFCFCVFSGHAGEWSVEVALFPVVDDLVGHSECFCDERRALLRALARAADDCADA